MINLENVIIRLLISNITFSSTAVETGASQSLGCNASLYFGKGCELWKLKDVEPVHNLTRASFAFANLASISIDCELNQVVHVGLKRNKTTFQSMAGQCHNPNEIIQEWNESYDYTDSQNIHIIPRLTAASWNSPNKLHLQVIASINERQGRL